jgi:glycosyltransferase involved in cell wall biosynthesis
VTLSDGTNYFYELSPSVQRKRLGLLKESANSVFGLINNLRRVLALRRVLRQTHPEVVLAMMDKANILLSLAAWGLPNIVALGSEHIHPPQAPLSPFWSGLRRFCYGHLAAVTTLTTESRDWLLRHTEVKKVAVIPNSAPWPLPKKAPFLMPQAVIPPGRKLLLAVGRLSEQKGFDLLIEAFGQIVVHHADWHLAILGDGPLRTSLFARIKRAGLEERITLAGLAGNIGDWYQAADLYVMSSRFEGFGNTLAEALVYGVPVISFDCDTGPRDIVRHEVDGLLVPSGDVMALVGALESLIGNEAMRQKFGAKAVEAREKFSLEKISSMWEALFTELWNKKR